MPARKSSHGTIFLIVSSGSPLALIASSLRSTSKKPFCPMTRSLHPPMTACGHRVRFARTWREGFFEVPIRGELAVYSFPLLTSPDTFSEQHRHDRVVGHGFECIGVEALCEAVAPDRPFFPLAISHVLFLALQQAEYME